MKSYECLFNTFVFYKKIIDNIPYITQDKYLIGFEIGYTQAKSIVEYANQKLDNIEITVEKDYSDKDRFIFIFN